MTKKTTSGPRKQTTIYLVSNHIYDSWMQWHPVIVAKDGNKRQTRNVNGRHSSAARCASAFLVAAAAAATATAAAAALFPAKLSKEPASFLSLLASLSSLGPLCQSLPFHRWGRRMTRCPGSGGRYLFVCKYGTRRPVVVDSNHAINPGVLGKLRGSRNKH
jgi:hypothetical protein